jgi:lysophospholipase L1-like esterase
LSGVDVRPARAVRGSIVALGDSITDGAYTTWNGNDRWTDNLAGRLQALPAFRQFGVLNQGIGGNQILTDRTDCCGAGTSISALKRQRQDVLLQTRVKYLILAEGINDIGFNADADALIAGMTTIVRRAHAAGIRVVGATITPYGCDSGCFGPEQEATRQRVNAWVRTSRVFDGVVDFDANIAGQKAMADSINLNLFR